MPMTQWCALMQHPRPASRKTWAPKQPSASLTPRLDKAPFVSAPRFYGWPVYHYLFIMITARRRRRRRKWMGKKLNCLIVVWSARTCQFKTQTLHGRKPYATKHDDCLGFFFPITFTLVTFTNVCVQQNAGYCLHSELFVFVLCRRNQTPVSVVVMKAISSISSSSVFLCACRNVPYLHSCFRCK